jgi:hypothetical protein
MRGVADYVSEYGSPLGQVITLSVPQCGRFTVSFTSGIWVEGLVTLESLKCWEQLMQS